MVTSNNKRRRTELEDTLHLSGLPDGIFTHVASFLAKPSRALFAVAMSWTTDNFCIDGEQQQLSSVILSSSSWETLDFVNVEKSLVVKLSDNDVYAVLQCIKANQTLKKLKLTGCVNITGRGLEPLRGSTVIVIEHIDLSLVKQYESPAIDPEPSISEAEVIPILDSIITADGNSH